MLENAGKIIVIGISGHTGDLLQGKVGGGLIFQQLFCADHSVAGQVTERGHSGLADEQLSYIILIKRDVSECVVDIIVRVGHIVYDRSDYFRYIGVFVVLFRE